MVDSSRAGEVSNGRVLEAGTLGLDGDGPWRLIGPDGDLLAIYERHQAGLVKPAVVMPTLVP